MHVFSVNLLITEKNVLVVVVVVVVVVVIVVVVIVVCMKVESHSSLGLPLE